MHRDQTVAALRVHMNLPPTFLRLIQSWVKCIVEFMKAMKFLWKVYFSLPPIIRQKLKFLLKRGAGHGSSKFNNMIAMRDANGKCRIDRFAQLFCDYLTASNITGIEGKRCLEIGTGYVGSSPVVMWLLGAQAVTSVDLNRLLMFGALKESILSVEKKQLFNLLRKHVKSEESLNNRINQIYVWADSKQENLPDCFSYLAPFDILAREFDEDFDFLFSVSTLEHIPRSIVSRFVERMASILASGGLGLHSIDLTDHFNSKEDPFRFLALKGEDYSEDSDADSRGNRIRGSEWLDVFLKAGLTADIVMSSNAPRSHLPGILASPFNEMNLEDLLLTSVLVRIISRK